MGSYPGWENETEASLARRTGVKPRPAPLEGEPVVAGVPLSALKGSAAPKRTKPDAHSSGGLRDGAARGAGPGGARLDRGRRQGAKWFLVDRDRNILEWKLAQAHKTQGRKFQSGKEAKRYVALLYAQDRGDISNLRCQVNFPLYARRPDGLMEKVCDYRCDFVYEERGVEVVEDVKGWKQDAYLLKSKWFAIQYGKAIRET